MAQQKSEDRVVPDGGVMPVQPAVSGQGKAVPVDQQALQLRLPIATAEHREGVSDRSGTDRVAVEPKAIVNAGQVAPVTMEEVAYRLTDALVKVVLNKGAPGPDGQTVEMLREQWSIAGPRLARCLLDGGYRPGGIRRAMIPKAGGGQRGLGIPNVIDRVVCEAVRQTLEPVWEPTFHTSSHGFRPGRSCHTAIAEAKQHVRDGYGWVVDIDLEKFLESSSHCLRVHGGGVEQAGFGLWDQYSQAFSASVADVEGFQLAALDTLQHGLAGNVEDAHRVDDRHVSGGASSTNSARSWSLTRIRHGAPGVSCSPRMNPAWSQRKMVEAATPSSSAALPTGSSSPSGGSAGGLCAGMLR
jgi:Reverse transcriptase (RNA-dependent DNA polymerase)